MLLGFGYKNREYYFSYVHKQYVQWDAGRTVQLARLLQWKQEWSEMDEEMELEKQTIIGYVLNR